MLLVKANKEFSLPGVCSILADLQIPGGLITIKDNSGRLLFFRKLQDNVKSIKINFPFNINNVVSNRDFTAKIIQLDKQRQVKALPPHEREREKAIKIRIANIENTPAKIYTDLGLIVFSNEWLLLPPSIKAFIAFHEYGHFFYKTEWKCDLFAASQLIKRGYNPSNCFYALSILLKDKKGKGTEAEARIKILHNNLKEYFI